MLQMQGDPQERIAALERQLSACQTELGSLRERLADPEQLYRGDGDNFALEPLQRLDRDLKDSAKLLSPREARYVVDLYYQIQEYRKRAANQSRAMNESGEPIGLVRWVFGNMETFEHDIHGSLARYGASKVPGQWARSIMGIGPVIAAGLLAHIDIRQAPTVGHIWRFAGLDPSSKWLGKDGAAALVKDVLGKRKEVTAEDIAEIGRRINRKPERVRAWNSTTKTMIFDHRLMTVATLTAGLARRPWNAKLKVVCWHAGESFVKTSNKEGDVYGHLYAERKPVEWLHNLSGDFSAQAEYIRATKKLDHNGPAWPFYAGCFRLPDKPVGELVDLAIKDMDDGFRPALIPVAAGEGLQMLPPGHIHGRAKRFAVKVFLSHYQAVAYEVEFGTPPPFPYILTRPEHTHYLAPPNWPMERQVGKAP